MCGHFGVIRCVLCVPQQFGHEALIVACGKGDHTGKRWAGNSFITTVPRVRRRVDSVAAGTATHSSLRRLRGGAQRRGAGRLSARRTGRRAGRKAAIWAVQPPK